MKNNNYLKFNNMINKFINSKIDLEKNEIAQAKNSLLKLQEEIIRIFDKDPFFDIFFDKSINYGSFFRHTKIKPLDDIDFMVCIKANYRTYSEYNDGIIKIHPNYLDKQNNNCLDSDYFLNSNKVSIFLKNGISKYYPKSDIRKYKEAVTLKLNSYDLNFDIVPSFYTEPEMDGRQYYLIPDGYGNWKKTDPIIDKENIKKLNPIELNTIKLIKYWNKEQKVITVSSYLLETMMIKYFQSNNDCNDIFILFMNALEYISKNILGTLNDPKKIQGDLIEEEDLNYKEKKSISIKAKEDYIKCLKIFKNINLNEDYIINKFSEVLNGFND